MLENRSFQAVVHVRDGSGHEYLTYTFSNAFVSSFQTTESDGAAPIDRITLSFDHVAEDYSDNHAQFDVSQNTVGAGGNLSAPALAAPPMVGITFDTGWGAREKIARAVFSRGGSVGGRGGAGEWQKCQFPLRPKNNRAGLGGKHAQNPPLPGGRPRPRWLRP